MTNTYKPSYNSRIKKNGTTIAGVKSGTFNTERGEIAVTALGSVAKEYLMGLPEATLEMTVMLDTSSNEQNALWDAYKNNTKLTDITVYYDSTAYIECDSNTDENAGVYVKNFPMGNFSPDESVIECSLTLRFTGAIKRSTD